MAATVTREMADAANTPRKKLAIITGPTAVGKTRIALQLARRLPLEIISADSMQVYKYLTIGTAKPTQDMLHDTPYHLIDLVEPSERFSMAQFITRAEQYIDQIYVRARHPLIVGGTGLYLKGLLYGIFTQHTHDEQLRARLQTLAREQGLPSLYQQLRTVDPQAAGRIHPHDQQRIIRALEVYQLTGTPLSQLQRQFQAPPRYDALLLVLTRSRTELYQLIERRVEEMFAQGFVDEVKQLVTQGFSSDLHSLKALGYTHVIRFFEGEFPLEEAKRRIKTESRQYAKRQLTWYKAMNDAQWVNLTGRDMQEVVERLQKMIARFLEIEF